MCLLAADYKNFDYVLAGQRKLLRRKAQVFGRRIRRARGSDITGWKAIRTRLKYNEYRVYGYKKFGKLDITADVIDVSYASPINGVKDAYSLSAGGQYTLTEAWKIGADVEYSHNPDFNSDYPHIPKGSLPLRLKRRSVKR